MVDESLGDAAEVFEQTPNQSLRSTTLQMLRCVSSPPGSTLSKNNHTNKDVAEPPASALPECSARPGPAGHAPASAHHAPAARRARTPTASHSHPHGSPQMSHVIPRHVFQTLKLGRCNSNVFRAYRKLTEGNYVRLFGAGTFCLPRGRNSSGGCTHSRGPGTPGLVVTRRSFRRGRGWFSAHNLSTPAPSAAPPRQRTPG